MELTEYNVLVPVTQGINLSVRYMHMSKLIHMYITKKSTDKVMNHLEVSASYFLKNF